MSIIEDIFRDAILKTDAPQFLTKITFGIYKHKNGKIVLSVMPYGNDDSVRLKALFGLMTDYGVIVKFFQTQQNKTATEYSLEFDRMQTLKANTTTTKKDMALNLGIEI